MDNQHLIADLSISFKSHLGSPFFMSMNNAASKKVTLPVRIQNDPSARGGIAIKSNGADSGWSTIECDDVEHARQIMTRYPSAAMPCWRNPNAVWNR